MRDSSDGRVLACTLMKWPAAHDAGDLWRGAPVWRVTGTVAEEPLSAGDAEHAAGWCRL